MISMVDALTRFPEELRKRPQWCVAGPDKAPYTASVDGKLYNASPVTGPWLTFEAACAYAQTYNTNVGYVLSEFDPYTCVDLDVKDNTSIKADGTPVDSTKWSTQEELDGYSNLVTHINSYTELSASGKGLHIWVRAEIGAGARRDGVEVYSQQRFIICTGNAIAGIQYSINKGLVVPIVTSADTIPLIENQFIIDQLVSNMRTADVKNFTLIEVPEELSDAEIFKRASTAGNAEKFIALCEGRWHEYKYPSQSEADLSLLSMFTFYSKSNEQCRRLFRMTKLGERPKAVKNDVYLNRTLRIIRGRQEREQQVSINFDKQAQALVQKAEEQNKTHEVVDHYPEIQIQLKIPDFNNTLPKPMQAILPAAPLGEHSPVWENSATEPLSWPPGLIGRIARFIYHSSPRPVQEIAIVAAFGLMAGMFGKAFTIPQSGLNVYIILVARSAIGKEAMHSGISLLIKKMVNAVPGSEEFVNFNDFASGPALVKACAETQSFVNIAGEWGRKLKRLSNEDGRDGPMVQLRTTMTNLYQKSGPTSIVGGMAYSNKDQNVSSVNGVAFSMIGETTPKTFYDSLTPSMMEDGFLSRFTVVEYNGDRPPANKNQILEPDVELSQALTDSAKRAIQLLSSFTNCPVGITEEALAISNEFDVECDFKINSTDDEAYRQMWNRAHLKVLRFAGLMAVADNSSVPVITAEHINWALMLIRRDIAIMDRKIKDGDIGQGDGARENKLLAILTNYLYKGVSAGYKIPEEMRKLGIVPRRYLQIRIQNHSSFTQHKLGLARALDLALGTLIDNGYIVEVNSTKLSESFGTGGKAYQIINLPDM